VGAAADDRQEIDEPRRREAPRDLGHVVRAEAPGREFVAGDAGPDHEVASYLPPDRREDFEGESHPVLEAPTVLVGALVEEGAPELIDQVVVRHGELDPVEAAGAAAARRLAERADQRGDLLGLELVGHLAVDSLRDLGGGQQHGRHLGIRLGPPAEMRQLGEDEAVVAVHGVGDLPIAGNDGVVVVGDLLPGRRRGGRMHARGPAEDREGAPAPCLRLMVAREPRCRPATLGHGLGVAGGVDPVLEGDGAHSGRREQRAKLVGHGWFLPALGGYHQLGVRDYRSQRWGLSFGTCGRG